MEWILRYLVRRGIPSFPTSRTSLPPLRSVGPVLVREFTCSKNISQFLAKERVASAPQDALPCSEQVPVPQLAPSVPCKFPKAIWLAFSNIKEQMQSNMFCTYSASSQATSS